MFETAVWLIPAAPFAAAVACILLHCFGKSTIAHFAALLGIMIAAVAALGLAISGKPESGAIIVNGYQFIQAGSMDIALDVRIDRLSELMLCVITVVGFFVCLFSSSYMRGDPGYARYFAIFSAFVGCMTFLVMAENLVILYAFWEGVGVCSYLLIGYWFQKPSASQAAIKAFLVNRVGDCGLILGILLLWWLAGQVTIEAAEKSGSVLDVSQLMVLAPKIAEQHLGLLTIAGCLMLLGAIGKSAQFPLHVWLPDAMEGPTPASALIHAATMVTAGVYLLCRMSPVFAATPLVYQIAGWLGAITALLGAWIALFQSDLKRVLAYSTVSQLGYMFMATSVAGVEGLMGYAVVAAMFHLFTHAFFKALLFLSAGNVMHAMGNVIDMRRFSGLDKHLPKTSLAFAVGAAALAGLPPLSGFWSKEDIYGVLLSGTHDPVLRTHALCFLVIGLFSGFLTATYSSRAYFLTFWGPEKVPHEAAGHVHENDETFFPLGVLGVGAVVAGVIVGPGHIMQRFIGGSFTIDPEFAHAPEIWLPLVSTTLAVVGVWLGWFTTRNREAASSSEAMPPTEEVAAAGLPILARIGARKFYLDELYYWVLIKPLEVLAGVAGWFDRTVVDGVSRVIAWMPRGFGSGMRRLQTGELSTYLWLGISGLLILVIWTSSR